ncbi:hypothetical protein BDR26DRAFT_858450 [Obelidium mucronatum]|nr:hypothetical protein BDR26DRAFT_858450 [Obelidium mucronatum]
MSQLANDRLLSEATLTVSSTDTTSPECLNNKCSVQQIANDGSGKEGFDETFWQSASDVRCRFNQWIKAKFVQPRSIYSFSIQYGSLIETSTLAQDGAHIAAAPQFTFLLIKSDNSTVDATSSLSCLKKTIPASTKSKNETVMDTCTLAWSNEVVGNVAGNAAGVQWVWTNLHNNPCQMNINELILTGGPASTNGVNPIDGSSSGFFGFLTGLFGGGSGNSGPTLPPPPSQQGLPIWSTIVMVLAAAILGVVGTIIYMRRRNVTLRKQVRRMLAEDRIGRANNSSNNSDFLVNRG